MSVSQQEKFKSNVIDFLQYCSEILDAMVSEGKLKLQKESIDEFKSIKELVQVLDGGDLIKKFSANTHEYWDAIKNKDKDFFNKNYMKIFGNISGDKLSLLRYIFIESDDEDIKESIWAYIHSFIKISIRHIFNIRLLELKETTDEKGFPKTIIRLKALNDYGDIKILDVAKVWSVELYPNFLSKK